MKVLVKVARTGIVEHAVDLRGEDLGILQVALIGEAVQLVVGHGSAGARCRSRLRRQGADRQGQPRGPLDARPPRSSAVAASDIPASTSRGKETFFDGKVFDPDNPAAYLKSLSIKRIEV